jgi:hypothetical protein
MNVHLTFEFALEYTVRKIQEDKEGLELNGTHQLQVNADDNLQGEISGIIKRNMDAQLDAGEEVNAV